MDETYSDPTGYPGHNGVVPQVSVKKCYFVRDGDHNQKPVFMAIKAKDYRGGIEKLQDVLTEKCDVPQAVRSIYTSHGTHLVRSLSALGDGEKHIVSTKGKGRAKGVDWQKVSESQNRKWYATNKKGSVLSDPGYISPTAPYEPKRAWASPAVKSDFESNYTRNKVPPKKVTLYRNGNPKQHHTMLLNTRTAQSFEQVKQDMNDMFQMNVVKVFAPDGTQVSLIFCL